MKIRKSIGDRIRDIVGEERGAQARFIEEIGVSSGRLSQYITGKNTPNAEFLAVLAEKKRVNINWLLTGNGDKYLPRESPSKKKKRPSVNRTIPILGAVPAGEPGGWTWTEYDAKDILEDLLTLRERDLIALAVQGESMYPTLFPNDLVIMTPHGLPRAGDLVVAEVKDGADYQIKRLQLYGKHEIVLASDNFLYYPTKSYPADACSIRGRVIKVIRTPNRKRGTTETDRGITEYYLNPKVREIVDRLPQLSEKVHDVVLNMIHTFGDAEL